MYESSVSPHSGVPGWLCPGTAPLPFQELRRTQEELKELQAERQRQEAAGRQRERELEKQLRVEADRGRGLEQQNVQLHKTLQQLRQDCEEASKARGVGTGLRRWRLRGLEG